MHPIYLLVGSNVRRFRKIRGLSQEALADVAGLHRTYIGSVERGERNVSVENIARLAQALNLLPYELLVEYDESLALNDSTKPTKSAAKRPSRKR